MNISDLRASLDLSDISQEMCRLISALYPICRSITGDGFRETLSVVGGSLVEGILDTGDW